LFYAVKGLYYATAGSEVSVMIENFVKEFRQAYPELADMFWCMDEQDLQRYMDDTTALIGSDIEEMSKMIRAGKVKLILQNYPPPLWQARQVALALYRINNALRGKAIELNIPFVDNEKLFLGLYDEGHDQKDYHCQARGVVGSNFNSKGQGAMAGFIHDKIIEEGGAAN
jgi:hypothetical protein